jgi:hypothetical protein
MASKQPFLFNYLKTGGLLTYLLTCYLKSCGPNPCISSRSGLGG